MNMTTHAETRLAQRAIGQEKIEAVLRYGVSYAAGEGARAYFLGRKAVEKAWRRFRVKLDDFKNLAVVLGKDGAIITVYHCSRPLKHWKAQHRLRERSKAKRRRR